MALTATIYHLEIELSDVDRNVYESLDLRIARHPSETMRYMLTRTIAYALSYEEGIAFSKGGLSSADEAPIAIHDPTGLMLAWIDIGAPSAERLHRAAKASPRVALYSTAQLSALQKEAATRTIHRVDAIEVWRLEPDFIDAIDAKTTRNTKLTLVRTDEQLYVTVGGVTLEGKLARERLVA